jgi:hypothetical protein
MIRMAGSIGVPKTAAVGIIGRKCRMWREYSSAAAVVMGTGVFSRQFPGFLADDFQQGFRDGLRFALVDHDPRFLELLKSPQPHPSADDCLDAESFQRGDRMAGAMSMDLAPVIADLD